MQSLFRYVSPPSQCGYLHDQIWQLAYEHVAAINAAEYMQLMQQGWRRFGRMLFRPRCPSCQACQSLRVLVSQFRPDRSQRRAVKQNEGVVQLVIGKPSVTAAKLDLYDRYHAYQTDAKGWPMHPAKNPDDYAQSFVDNPFPTEEWCYYINDRLAAVSYVDVLPGGMSAIYCFYDPEKRSHSLGTFNVLKALDEARRRGVPHVYLGYFVAGSPSMTYKSRFMPNQVLGLNGQWHDFLS